MGFSCDCGSCDGFDGCGLGGVFGVREEEGERERERERGVSGGWRGGWEGVICLISFFYIYIFLFGVVWRGVVFGTEFLSGMSHVS